MQRVAARSVRLFSSAAAPAVPESPLAYRALLRNLRLLAGMRGEKTNFRAVITGIGANEVAESMRKLEPSVTFELAGDGKSADFGACRVVSTDVAGEGLGAPGDTQTVCPCARI
jgi:hypothetical protein